MSAGAAAVLAGFALPWIIPSKIALSLLAQALFDALLATSVGFLILQNGRVSFGQAAFSGLGGYAFGVLVARKLLGAEAALAVALVLPTLAAFLLGLVIARVSGVAHAMLTLAVGQALYEIAFRWRELAKGDDGMSFEFAGANFRLPVSRVPGPGFDGRTGVVDPGRGAGRARFVHAQPHRQIGGGDTRQRRARSLSWFFDDIAPRPGIRHRGVGRRRRRRAAGGL